MNYTEIKFNNDRSMKIKIPEQDEEIALSISDSLSAYDEDVGVQYKERISEFVNYSNIWYQTCLGALHEDGSAGVRFRLMELFVLSEQNSDCMIFGALFNVDGDREHGRGFKIKEKDFLIVEYGLGDIAYA